MIKREISCSFCKRKFLRKIGQINEARKFSWRQYCSWNYLSKDKLRGTKETCKNCGKKIYRPIKEVERSKSGRFFCSNSCAAIINASSALLFLN